MSGIFTPLSEIEDQETEWLWPGYIPLGCITTLDGDLGRGKSSLIAYLAAVVSSGRLFYQATYSLVPSHVLVVQSEDPPHILCQNVLANQGVTERVHTQSLPQRQEHPLRFPGSIGILAAATRANDIRLLIIDPIADFFSCNLNNDQAVRQVLRPLAAMAAEERVAVVLVRHLNQSARGNPLYRGSGSIGIIGAARSGLLVASDPRSDARRLLVHYKSNLSPLQPILAYRLVQAGDGRRLDWLGGSGLSALEVLGGTAGPMPSTKRSTSWPHS